MLMLKPIEISKLEEAAKNEKTRFPRHELENMSRNSLNLRAIVQFAAGKYLCKNTKSMMVCVGNAGDDQLSEESV